MHVLYTGVFLIKSKWCDSPVFMLKLQDSDAGVGMFTLFPEISLSGDYDRSLIWRRGTSKMWCVGRGLEMCSTLLHAITVWHLLPLWVFSNLFMRGPLYGNVTPGAGCCRLTTVLRGLVKFLGVLLLLYIFICSLDLLSNAFRLLGGKTAGQWLF